MCCPFFGRMVQLCYLKPGRCECDLSSSRPLRPKEAHLMRRILLLAATMTLALVLVGGVAISKQPPPTSDKGSGSIPRSTVVKASFANGSGVNFLGVKVSDRGNLLSFESPQGQENAFSDAEGYAVCSTQFGDETVGERVNGHDTGSVFGGFAAPTFSQPNGAGTFPLT